MCLEIKGMKLMLWMLRTEGLKAEVEDHPDLEGEVCNERYYISLFKTRWETSSEIALI